MRRTEKKKERVKGQEKKVRKLGRNRRRRGEGRGRERGRKQKRSGKVKSGRKRELNFDTNILPNDKNKKKASVFSTNRNQNVKWPYHKPTDMPQRRKA